MLNKIKKIFTDSHKEALKAGMVEGERVSVMGGGGKLWLGTLSNQARR
ncbi:MAG: hypothetical protein Q4D37_11450 [Oscillospiraceae bacterium]|nr:hypothetical protein [Oscillospiraceae bacterium]